MTQYNFAKGFQDLSTEHSNVIIKENVKSLPTWLQGLLLKVGPARFTIGKNRVNHWFDGLAMLYKFEFRDNKILFSNSFIKSSQYNAHLKQAMICDEFATKAPLGLFGRLKNILETIIGKSMLNPSCNVNIVKINKQFIAMTEVNNNMSFDSLSLGTLGSLKYHDTLKGVMTTAHPMFDSAKNELINVLINIAPGKVDYLVYKLDMQSNPERKLICQFTRPYVFYMHSFFITKNHIILYDGPLHTTATRLLRHTFNDSIEYKQEHMCQFIIISRNTGQIHYIPAPAFVFLHGVNSYEPNGDQIILDLIVYPAGGNPYNMFYLDKLAKNNIDLTTELRRYSIDLNQSLVSYATISCETIEFPYINRSYHNQEYQYIYAVYRDSMRAGDFLNGLIKIDINRPEEKLCWHEADFYPSEPIFIKNPEAENEDDGIIMTNVFNSRQQLSYLLILNAKDFVEIERIELPCHIPFTLHGNFYP